MDWRSAGAAIKDHTDVYRNFTSTASARDINNALATCPAGSVVFLAAGTYTLSTGLVFQAKSDCTLRGEGSIKTILRFSGAGNECGGNTANVCIINKVPPLYRYSADVQVCPLGTRCANTAAANWVGNYAAGTRTISLDNTSTLSPDMLLIVDQDDDDGEMGAISLVGCTETGTTATCKTKTTHSFGIGDPLVVGGVRNQAGDAIVGYNTRGLVTAVASPTSFSYTTVPGLVASATGGSAARDDGSFHTCTRANICRPDRQTGGSTRCTISANGTDNCIARGGDFRSRYQIVKVQLVNGSEVSFADNASLHMSFDPSRHPAAWWIGRASENIGIEDLTLDNSNSTAASGIVIEGCYNCWVSNVYSRVAGKRNHIWLFQTARVTVRDSYFYRSSGTGPSKYGIEFWYGSDSLVENNIFDGVIGATMMQPANGNVIAYNYFPDVPASSPSDGLGCALCAGHDAGSMLNLFEGNIGTQMWEDMFHGWSGLQTLFRNYLTGWQAGASKFTYPINLYAGARAVNVVGNVLGRVGYHSVYEDSNMGRTGDPSHSIYVLGFPRAGDTTGAGAIADSAGIAYDPHVASTLMRWGNYDVVTSTTRWDRSEVPSTLPRYRNPVPLDHNLPASFYRDTQPAFWRTPWAVPRWPPIGPDVNGGGGPGGHVYAIPAQLCYEHTARDGRGELLFDGNSCYHTTGPERPSSPRSGWKQSAW